MHEIDRSFRAKRIARSEQRARALRRRAAGAGLLTLAAVLAGTAYLTRDIWLPGWQKQTNLTDPTAGNGRRAGSEVEPETQPEAPPRPVFVNAIIDLAGDPLIIHVGNSSDVHSKLREVRVTPDLARSLTTGTVAVLSDTMLSSSQRITALPSSPEDFAFFQSQSARGKPLVRIEPVASPELPVEEDDEALGPDADEVLVPVAGQADLGDEDVPPVVDEETSADPLSAEPESGPSLEALSSGKESAGDESTGGWGEMRDGQSPPATFRKTEIDDTTTVRLVRPEIDRFREIEDFTVSVTSERPLDRVIAEYGFSDADAKAASDAARALLGVDVVKERHVVGLRGHRARKGARPELVQVSINAPDRYLGTVARDDEGRFVSGADPWINEDLSQYAGQATTAPQSYRLLDAIYSTATRSNVPSSVTGQAIMLVSRAFDLQALATRDDRLVLAYEQAGPNGEAGRVLYVAIKGVDRDFECFVYQPQPGAEFACMTEKDATHSITVVSGMVTPVRGVLTSTFGPRRHPIFKEVRNHTGVDWAAPVGTPVMAAFDGKVIFAGDGKGYGNVIRVDHGDGRSTAYAHLSRFAEGMGVAVKVKAGDVIGYVGSTGQSTGPHLHFELYRNGVAVDPLGSAVAGGPPAETAVAAGSDGTAVELLVNRIIHVESGGNARAKNPLSSATGLGQFIKSTWLRMIRTYRPDLYRSMSETELLELRYDPTISREMVANLARENEARLRAHGHAITAGRLYLAHFLGPEGAHQALSAPGNALVADVLGAAVVAANPFLTGKDCAYVVAWAERKMTGKAVRYAGSSGITTRTVVQTSPEFIAYKEAMLKLVEMAQSDAADPDPAADDTQAPDAPSFN